MRRLLAALALAALGLSANPALAEGQSIIVLDASGSMWGQIDGRTKIDIAREALAGVVAELPADSAMGLMAYGHREKGSCDDIELIIPPSTGTGQAIIDAANALQFKGKTPLTESVRRAAEALRSSEEKATVILITDGIETCEADPCALGLELESSGVDFTAHVVGFGLTAEEGQKVACLAENTGGKYIEASDLDSLAMALQTTVIEAVVEPAPEPEPAPAPAPEPVVLTENVDPSLVLVAGAEEPENIADAVFDFFPLNADSSIGDRFTTIYGRSLGQMPAGAYRMVAQLGSAKAEVDVTVTADQLATPQAVLNAGVLSVALFQQEGVPVTGDVAWEAKNAEGIDGYGYAATGSAVLPVGDYALQVTYGAAKHEETVSIKPGETLHRDIVLGTGHVLIDAYYTEGMVVDAGDHFTEVFEAKAALDGSRKSVAYGYGPARHFDLSPGDYVVKVTMGSAEAEVGMTVTAGGNLEVPVVLNAGVLAITAPGAEFIEVFEAKKDIQGNRKSRAYAYTPEYQTTLSAGDYIAVVTRGEAKTETAFTIKAGERSEVTAP